jgi:hypothetical protein
MLWFTWIRKDGCLFGKVYPWELWTWTLQNPWLMCVLGIDKEITIGFGRQID